MKKLRTVLIISMILILSLSLISCNGNVKSNDDNGDAFDEASFLQDIMPGIRCLNECYAEMFFADADMDTMYYALYDTEEAAQENRYPAVLYREGDVIPEGYIEDPAAASFFPVSNFSTNAEIKENLMKYMSEEVVEMFFNDDLLEYEGGLYLIRGGRGYGALSCDEDSVEYAGSEGESHFVDVKCIIFDEYDHTDRLEFVNEDGNWIIKNIKKI